MIYGKSYDSSIGKITIQEEQGAITQIAFGEVQVIGQLQETKLIKKAYEQLQEYLEGKRKEFSLPLQPKGTSFMKKVWQALQTIPYGQTRCYQEIATKIGNPKAARAVGMANNKNPIAIIIPCHRVIGKNGEMVGYAAGLEIKKQLLILENENT